MPISIIIPTHNRSGMLLRAVDSVFNQSFKDFELIIVDDGSTDHTEKWIKGYTDPRLKYFKTEHHGVAHARTFGVRQARADWICFLDSDDLWRRHKLSEQIRFHMAHPEILISQTDDLWIRKGKRVNKMKKHEFREGNLFK
jgi:glycosyltransferase involved in cell wall biosynthesis